VGCTSKRKCSGAGVKQNNRYSGHHNRNFEDLLDPEYRGHKIMGVEVKHSFMQKHLHVGDGNATSKI
jgi:ABC-type Fe3+ transport system substrate-binding protein